MRARAAHAARTQMVPLKLIGDALRLVTTRHAPDASVMASCVLRQLSIPPDFHCRDLLRIPMVPCKLDHFSHRARPTE